MYKKTMGGIKFYGSFNFGKNVKLTEAIQLTFLQAVEILLSKMKPHCM